jgi:hypothetical protein
LSDDEEIRNPQFHLRSLLIMTVLVGLDFSVLAQLRHDPLMIVYLILVQCAVLFICWICNTIFAAQHGKKQYPTGGLTRGIATAGAIYLCLLCTLIIARESSDAGGKAMAVTTGKIVAAMLIVPVASLAISIIGACGALVAGTVVCIFAYGTFNRLLSSLSNRVQCAVLGGSALAVAPSAWMLALTLGKAAFYLNAWWIEAGVLLPAIVGVTICYFVSRELE